MALDLMFKPGGGGSGSVSQPNVNGLVNYIYLNYDAEVGTTGWATFADAASATPVDGTGGSPNVTWGVSSTTPLRGIQDFNFVKDAANRQGQGVSYDFTINSADTGKVLNISFDYEKVSGTYADLDMSVWIYDVTNAIIIQPSGYSILNGTIPQKKIATFQTASNSTSYRLILYCGSTSASAYTLAFDNFVVGPQIVEYGAPVTDWVSYTPTGSWVSNTTYTGFWRRVGSNLEIAVKVATSGAPTSASLTVTLPSGLSIDTTKIADSTAAIAGIGTSTVQIRDVSSDQFFGTALYSSTTAIAIFKDDGDGSISAVTQAAPMTWASGDFATIEVSGIPIVGWSSSVIMSNDTDTRIVSAIYSCSSGDTSTTTNPFDYDTKIVDTHGAVTTGATTWKFTCPVPGQYSITVGLSSATATAGLNNLYVYKNGVLSIGLVENIPQNQAVQATGIVSLVAGDTIDIRNGSVSTTTLNVNANINRISIFKLSGPAAIAATDDVNARYYASATSISGSLATIVWTTKDFDSANAMSSGLYTIAVAGKYQVNAGLAISGTFALNSQTVLEIQKNSTAVSNITMFAGGVITNSNVSISDIINCVAGDVIRIQLSSGATGPAIVSSNTRNFISISRVGN